MAPSMVTTSDREMSTRFTRVERGYTLDIYCIILLVQARFFLPSTLSGSRIQIVVRGPYCVRIARVDNTNTSVRLVYAFAHELERGVGRFFTPIGSDLSSGEQKRCSLAATAAKRLGRLQRCTADIYIVHSARPLLLCTGDPPQWRTCI